MVLFIIHLYFGLHWFFTAAWAFSSWRWVVTTLIVHRLLIAMSSLVVENRLSEAMWASTAVLQHGISSGSVQALVCKGSVVAACRLGCSTACRIFPDQRGNPCPCTGRILLHCTTREIYADIIFETNFIIMIIFICHSQSIIYSIWLLRSFLISWHVGK